MRSSSKIIRELRRLTRLGHWANRVRFLVAVVASSLRQPPKFKNMDALLTDVQGQSHAIILVIYCPLGMPGDTRDLIIALQKEPDIHLMIISKTALQNHDAEFLNHQGCHFAITQNTGYDFESYRNGVLTVLKRIPRILKQGSKGTSAPNKELQHSFDSTKDENAVRSGIAFQKLTIMNDTCQILDVRHLVRILMSPVRPASWVGFFLQGRKRTQDRHLGSFCLTFGKELFQGDAFARFWKTYKPSNNRDYTIRLGEIGLSQALFSAGYEFEVLYEKSALLLELSNQPLEALIPLAGGLHACEILNGRELEAFSDMSLEQAQPFLAGKIENTESLRLMPIFSLLLGLPIAKRRNLRAYPELAAWYQEHVPAKSVD